MSKVSQRARLLIGLCVYGLSCAATVLVLVLVHDPAVDRWIITGLAAFALAMSLWFVTSYHVGTHGRWRRTDLGVHMMSFGLAYAATLGYVVLASFGLLPRVVMGFLVALTYLTTGWLFGWRTLILRGYLRKDKE